MRKARIDIVYHVGEIPIGFRVVVDGRDDNLGVAFKNNHLQVCMFGF
jgi:hypothetical protein